MLNAPDSAAALDWSRGSYSITFNILHCADALAPKSQQDVEVKGRKAWPALVIREMSHTLPWFYSLVSHRGKYTIKHPLSAVSTQLFSIFLCPRGETKLHCKTLFPARGQRKMEYLILEFETLARCVFSSAYSRSTPQICLETDLLFSESPAVSYKGGMKCWVPPAQIEDAPTY